MEDRVIRVKGQGTVSVPPDTVEIHMVLITERPTYEEVLDAANEALEDLRDCLMTEGFSKEDIKTVSFRVNTKYENVKVENDTYKRVFVGYEVTNSLKLEFKQDTAKISKVINTISNCPSTPEFSIRYKLKDDAKVRNLLLRRAVDDAKERAKVISQAAGIRLGKILNIDYIPADIQVNSEMYSIKSGSYVMQDNAMIDLIPQNIEMQDSIIIVWKIES